MRACITIVLCAVATMVCAPAALADQSQSSNWAGYAVHGTIFHRVRGTWRQPAVTCTRGRTTFSAYWVGLGGYALNSPALEQIGTEADCGPGGSARLSAWYEMVPQASMPIAMRVMPGDLIDAQVTVTGHRATMSLRDRTRHHTFSITVSGSPIDVSSAEWIVEAPSACESLCVTLPLADFGSTVFSAARAQSISGHWGGVVDPAWSTTSIRLSPGDGRLAAYRPGRYVAGTATPSGLAGGSSFTVSYAQEIIGTNPFYARRHAPVRAGHIVRPARLAG